LFWQAVAQRNNKEIKISSIRRFVAARNASVTLGRHAPHRHVGGGHATGNAGRHDWRLRDSVNRRSTSYLMFIMLITCQSLFKMDDEVVAFVAGAGFLMIAGAVQFQRRRRRKRTVWVKP